MKKRKIIVLIIVFLLIGGIIGGYFIINNKKLEESKEIVPEEEISEEQMRQTIVSLYFYNNDTKELSSEGRIIDAKELLQNPYQKLMELLIAGPENQKLVKIIPEGTKINKAELKGDILYLDLSKEFIENHEGGENKESITIYSIVNTMTNLTEVNSVKILIDGKEDMAFKDNLIKFDDPFVVIKKEENNIENNIENNLNSLNEKNTINN
jgi:germination protein M